VRMWLRNRAGNRWQDDAGTPVPADTQALVREAKRLVEELEG